MRFLTKRNHNLCEIYRATPGPSNYKRRVQLEAERSESHSSIKLRAALIVMARWMVIMLVCLGPIQKAEAFGVRDFAEIGGAYLTHLFMHEMGHETFANEVGAESHQMSFFTQKNGRLYPGVSTFKSIPEESRLPYAIAGDRMAGLTFEYGLADYRRNPTTFNKALMFFSIVDFFAYTLLSNYVCPDEEMYDPNLVRQQAGISKEMLLSVVLTKTLLNAYRIFNVEDGVVPMLHADKHSVAFVLQFHF